MSAAEIVEELKQLGSESIKKVLMKHGIKEPLLGVKVEELKKIQKRIKMDYRLALELYETGIYDAQYLACLITDDSKMSKKDLQTWVKQANSVPLCSSALAWTAAESSHGWSLALEWIDSKDEKIALTGWSTLSSIVSIKDDAEIDVAAVKKLLTRVQKSITNEPNWVRSAMNSFMIAVGTYLKPLTAVALETANKIGKVSVDVGDTACKIPSAAVRIEQAQKKGTIGRKRKTAKC